MEENKFKYVSRNTIKNLSLHDCDCTKFYYQNSRLVFEMKWMEVLANHPLNPYNKALQSGISKIELINPKYLSMNKGKYKEWDTLIPIEYSSLEEINNNVSNINFGLKEKIIFDLALNKYISKVVVQNNKGTKTYDYDYKTFGKVEIHRKQINGSLVVLEYTIKVKNEGEIAGYAKNIVDYLPNGLTFSSELNKDWYLSGNYLYTKGLENIEIEPGEEKEIKLVLTKTMTGENTGLINNRAEIYQDYNKFGEVDIDSIPNNQAQNEDDFSSVDIIIGIKTGGSTIAGIILLVVNLVLIAIVIRLMISNGIIKISTKKERR